MPHSEDRASSRLRELGWSSRLAALRAASAHPDATAGRVVRHDGATVRIAGADGLLVARASQSPAPLVVGDWVLLEAGTGRVLCVLDRASLLVRRDPGTGDPQPIAANVDVVVAVLALDRRIPPGFVERLATVAQGAGARSLFVLTKADGVDDIDAAVDSVRRAASGAEVLAVSALTGIGLDELRRRILHATIVLLGASGAGKSTLVNAIAGRNIATIGAVREGDRKGRHTTTARWLHACPDGVCVIDTPGVRELGVATDLGSVDSSFRDIADLAAACRFSDCAHSTEPGCAILAAVAAGQLDSRRVDSWQQLRLEAASSELRADTFAHRNAQREQARVYREVQRLQRWRKR